VGRVAIVMEPNPRLPKAYSERAALAEPDRAVPVTCLGTGTIASRRAAFPKSASNTGQPNG
jgi:hypothetical protein